MNKHLTNLLLALGFTLPIAIALYLTEVRTPNLRQQLLTQGRYCVAQVTCVKYHRKKNITWPVYRFQVNGKTYQTSNNGILQTTNLHYFDQWALNREFWLVYLPSDPSKNSILPYCPVSPEFSKQTGSWSTLHEGKSITSSETQTNDPECQERSHNGLR